MKAQLILLAREQNDAITDNQRTTSYSYSPVRVISALQLHFESFCKYVAFIGQMAFFFLFKAMFSREINVECF